MSMNLAGLDQPTSIAVDPVYGHMFWADAGAVPKIEMAWLDGSKRRPLVLDRVRHPTGLTIDFAHEHVLYWADTKLNTIDVIRQDGTNRNTILKGGMVYNVALQTFLNK